MDIEAIARKQLKENPIDGVKWITEAKVDDYLNAVGKAFAGSETCRPEEAMEWGLRGFIPTVMNNPERFDVYKFIMSLALKDFISHGAFFFGTL